MSSHMWGDKDFDWNALGNAQSFIHTWSKRLSGLTVWTKEKYGTIRYEFTCMWGWSDNKYIARYQAFIVKFVVMCATLRFRTVKEEICEDFICMWSDVKEGQVPWHCKFGLKENPWKTIN